MICPFFAFCILCDYLEEVYLYTCGYFCAYYYKNMAVYLNLIIRAVINLSTIFLHIFLFLYCLLLIAF